MSTSSIEASSAGPDPASIVQVLRTLAGYWPLIALCTVACFGLAVTAALVMKPVYRSETLLSYNDLAHLPVELRTGLPDVYPV